MRTGRTLALLAGVGAVLLTAYLLGARAPTPPSVTGQPAAGAGTAKVMPGRAESGRPAASSSAPEAPAARPARPSQRMREEFATAADLRAFAYAAMARPEEGGYFYARHAASICGQDVRKMKRLGDEAAANELRETGTIAPARLQAAEQFQRQCGSFTEGEVTAILKQINAKAASGEDPLLSAHRETIDTLLRRKQWGQAGALFERLARLDDPLLWTQDGLFRFIVSSDPETQRTGGFFFDGRVYGRDDQDAAEAWSAIELGFCGKGTCTLDLRTICLGGGFCGDHAGLVKSQYFADGGTEEGWRRVLALEQRVRAGIEAGATGMFVQPARRP